MNPVLTFDANGIGHCLHTDAIPLQTLGTLEVHRATSIEFNSADQQWEVKAGEGAILFTNPSRSCCLAWEIENFNQ
jgi:hypothetical protein